MSRRDLLIGVALLVAVAVVFGPSVRHDFINYDDIPYVANPHVREGLSLDGVRWAFTAFHSANWHPLTWLSHMLDVELFGMDPRGHHLTAVVLHGLNAALLFFVLSYLTGAPWRSALVAGLFALHPLHVESVMWIAERKDLLSTLFGWSSLWAYAWFVRHRGVGSYALSLTLFAASLMSKPMLVTLPFVMLLLDRWPLDRPMTRRLWVEKIPYFVLSLGSGIVTVAAQHAGGAVRDLEQFPAAVRLANAAVAYLTYAWKTMWPAPLAPFYPLRGMPAAWLVLTASLFLIAACVVAWRAERTRPWVTVGWLWYVVTLLPVIGIVQVGHQSMADRYTYVPLVGLFLLVAWGLGELVSARVAAAVVVIALVPLALASRQQVARWKDSVTLFEHTVAVTQDNHLALTQLAAALGRQGRLDEAASRYRQAIEIRPDDPLDHYNLGLTLLKLGRADEAVAELEHTVRLDPRRADAHNNLGAALLRQGRVFKALRSFETAVQLRPELASAHFNLGEAFLSLGRTDEAIRAYETALRLRPDLAVAEQRLRLARSRRP